MSIRHSLLRFVPTPTKLSRLLPVPIARAVVAFDLEGSAAKDHLEAARLDAESAARRGLAAVPLAGLSALLPSALALGSRDDRQLQLGQRPTVPPMLVAKEVAADFGAMAALGGVFGIVANMAFNGTWGVIDFVQAAAHLTLSQRD